jgi:hypothetical protein
MSAAAAGPRTCVDEAFDAAMSHVGESPVADQFALLTRLTQALRWVPFQGAHAGLQWDAVPAPDPRASSVRHVIWNVLLADKSAPPSPQAVAALNIALVVAIVPRADAVPALPPGPELLVLAYGDEHEPVLSADTLAAWDAAGARVDALARATPAPGATCRPHALVFCNAGFQRSVPFLVRYLTRFHAEEAPTVGAALDLVQHATGTVAPDGEARDRQLAALRALGLEP